MKTPIYDFLNNYREKQSVRMHMPGHKGKDVLGFEQYDITEISGADVLYSANGIIKESMQNAAALFNTASTFYSTEGSSLCIRAILFMAKQYALNTNTPFKILAGRNAHVSVISTAALLDAEVDFIYPENLNVISNPVTPKNLEKYLKQNTYTLVYVTSPDYLGGIADIKGISEVCRKYNCILAVDNAHGAYLKFLNTDIHPITLGADICCDSAHKTLPVLTGGAYLHISPDAPELFNDYAQNALKTFASTSPSYLILSSLDRANTFLEQQPFKAVEQEVLILKKQLPFKDVSDEPFKITLCPKEYGYTGEEVADFLRSNNIEVEFSDPDYCVLMLSPQDVDGILKVKKALSSIILRSAITQKAPELSPLKRATSMNKAIYLPFEEVKVADSLGRICAAPSVNCPPAVSIAVCGEIIDRSAIELMQYYGIKTIKVLKQNQTF